MMNNKTMPFKKMGDVRRTRYCPVCERQYRGDPRTVNRLIGMHCKVVHNVTLDDTQSRYIQVTIPYAQRDHDRDETRGVRILQGSEHLDELRSKNK